MGAAGQHEINSKEGHCHIQNANNLEAPQLQMKDVSKVVSEPAMIKVGLEERLCGILHPPQGPG